MTVYAFTGPREIVQAEAVLISGFLSTMLRPVDLAVVGGASGVDTAVAEFLFKMGRPVHLCKPSAAYNEACDTYATTWEQCSQGRNAGESYRIRNERMVELCNWLIAFPKTADEQMRSGTWMTVRIARKAAKPVIFRPLNDPRLSDGLS